MAQDPAGGMALAEEQMARLDVLVRPGDFGDGGTLGTLHYKYYFRMGEVREYNGSPAPMGAWRSR